MEQLDIGKQTPPEQSTGAAVGKEEGKRELITGMKAQTDKNFLKDLQSKKFTWETLKQDNGEPVVLSEAIIDNLTTSSLCYHRPSLI